MTALTFPRFNPRAPRAGRATRVGGADIPRAAVSIRARPVRGARQPTLDALFVAAQFQSARAPCGARDAVGPAVRLPSDGFNPRAPRAGRATRTARTSTRPTTGFNPRAPRAGRATAGRSRLRSLHRVSIRARPVRGARRTGSGRARRSARRFNPRAPRAGRATKVVRAYSLLSGVSIRARPVRGARRRRGSSTQFNQPRFNPRAPRAGRATGAGRGEVDAALRFNPRAPRAGRATRRSPAGAGGRTRFNPRAPRAGRATLVNGGFCGPVIVSIRARPVRGARPCMIGCRYRFRRCFNPRAPRAGRATWASVRRLVNLLYVSIRARPVRGARRHWGSPTGSYTEFQSARAPCGARDSARSSPGPGALQFQSARAPCGARDMLPGRLQPQLSSFNPRAPRAGRATTRRG